MAVPVLVLPFKSVTVKVTVTGVPTLAQEYEVCDALKLATPHASVVPLFNSKAGKVAVPAALK